MPDVRVHYDFASSLCCVAQRVMDRMHADLERLDIRLLWSPLDLSRMTGWRRGVEIPADRRTHLAGLAAALGVDLLVPRVWPDSRAANAAALAAEALGREAVWRERVWTALHREGRDLSDRSAVLELAREIDLPLGRGDLDRRQQDVDRLTRGAWAAAVTGVPTFMLDDWPLGGIQSDDTMRSIFRRWAERRGRRSERTH